MQVFIGTSGWFYGWNPYGSFDWYLKNSNLNAIELNASFYRFPFPNQVKSWKRKTKDFGIRWSIKVNRLITHVFKLSEKAFTTWKKFEKIFEPLDKYIDFFLFQLPPILTPNSAQRIAKFYEKTKLGKRFALEWRNIRWFSEEWIEWSENLGLTLVSVDAPNFTNFPKEIFCINEIVYLRMHGRNDWYSHNYSKIELSEIKQKILNKKPSKVYIFFNNNTNMLKNAQSMLEIFNLEELERNLTKFFKK